MSNVKVIAYTISEEEVNREAAVDYLNRVLNEHTTRDVWLRGIDVNDHLQYEGGGYLDDDEVEVDFIRQDDSGLYTVVFKNEENKEKLIEITIEINKIEHALSAAT